MHTSTPPTSSLYIKDSLVCDPSSSHLCTSFYTCPSVIGLGLPLFPPTNKCCVYSPANLNGEDELDVKSMECGGYTSVVSLMDYPTDPTRWEYGVLLKYTHGAFDHYYIDNKCNGCEESGRVCGYSTVDNDSFVCVCNNGVNTTTQCSNFSDQDESIFWSSAQLHTFSSVRMEHEKRAELATFLKDVPSVEFCCVYGSSLHPNNKDKSAMVDYILGVSDPMQWHSEISQVADKIGVGVHFNPFVTWNDKMLKYGVVRMHDLVQDILSWDGFYLSGRLQKPVHILVDNLDIENLNSVNLRAAMSAALLLLPSNFTQEDLFVKVCSLSYMGDLRMLFAEDKNKVTKIVQGQFDLFQLMYKPFLQEYEAKDFLRFSSSGNRQVSQDCSLPITSSLVSSLPAAIRSQMGMKLGERNIMNRSGRVINEVMISSREEAAKCMQKVLRRTVLISSARQAVSGLIAAGGVSAARYVAKKVHKAWKSWT
ncbi:hypothetical protein LWI28_004282 [Acer negundo]|uniref:Phosphatidate cytidylyltransferase, mitochondrial n=1 Tax=Acer negundo TaxID=4023 RepID=A0AAD5IHD4_ACENE|nr:hypothetical protein LWI28_004282 [Acer negundo]